MFNSQFTRPQSCLTRGSTEAGHELNPPALCMHVCVHVAGNPMGHEQANYTAVSLPCCTAQLLRVQEESVQQCVGLQCTKKKGRDGKLDGKQKALSPLMLQTPFIYQHPYTGTHVCRHTNMCTLPKLHRLISSDGENKWFALFYPSQAAP